MNLAQGLADGTFVRLGAAFAVFGEAVGKDDGAINGADDVQRRDFVGVAAEAVAPIGALLRAEESGFVELLEDFGEEGEGDMVALGDLFGGGDAVGGVYGEVLEGDESVVGFFGEFEHGVDRRCRTD